MTNTNEFSLVPSLNGLPDQAAPDPQAALAASYRADHSFGSIQETIEGLNRPNDQANAYLEMAWALLVGGKNPDPFILQSFNSAAEYASATERSRRGEELLTSDRDSIFEMNIGVAHIAAERKLPLAAAAFQVAYETIENYPFTTGTPRKDMLHAEAFNQSSGQDYVRSYIAVVVPALTKLASFVLEYPEVTDMEPRDIVNKANEIAWDKRVDFYRQSYELAKCAETLIEAYAKIGDGESIHRVIGEIMRRRRGALNTHSYEEYDRAYLRANTLSAAFNARFAGSVNFDNLTETDVENVILAGSEDSQKALGKVLQPQVAEVILQREDVSNSSKRNIIEGLELKMQEDENKARAVRNLLEARRQDLKDKD